MNWRLDTRSGFALITVLWLITILSGFVAATLAGTRLSIRAAQNRAILTRARWAASACAAIAQATWRRTHSPDSSQVDLGRTVSCRWRIVDPTARINVNTAPAQTLTAIVGDSAASRILYLRQRRAIQDLRELEGRVNLSAPVLEYLTTEGPGTINANAAPYVVLSAIRGLGPEAVQTLLSVRAHNPPRSLDALLGELPPRAGAALLSHYAYLQRILTFDAPQLLLTAQGWVGPDPSRLGATVEQLVVPAQLRLAVIRQRVRM